MKGLLRNSFYGATGGAAVLIAAFGLFGIFVVLTGNPTLLNVFGFPCATAFTVIALSSFRKDASTNWSKYVISAPVRRKDIVKSRYIIHAAWLIAGTVLLILVVGLAVLIHGNRFFFHPVRDPMTLLCVSIGIPLLLGGLFYPITCIAGPDKSEIVMVISLLGALGITAGIIWLVNISFGYDSVSDAEYFAGLGVFMGIALLFFVLSYYLTVSVNRKKEY